MTIKMDNFLGLDGKVEAYHYIWLVFIGYFVSLVLSFFKSNITSIISIIALTISIIVLTIGIFDMQDSFVMNYVNLNKKGILNTLSFSYLMIVILNIILIAINF